METPSKQYIKNNLDSYVNKHSRLANELASIVLKLIKYWHPHEGKICSLERNYKECEIHKECIGGCFDCKRYKKPNQTEDKMVVVKTATDSMIQKTTWR